MSIKEHPAQIKTTDRDKLHIPVLLDTMLDKLHPVNSENYLDLTTGYGGHAEAFLKQTTNYTESVLVDRDEDAIKYLQYLRTKGAQLLHTDFVTAASELSEAGRQFNIIVVDLGVSSPQFDQGERGFSLQKDGPLDMRMDRSQMVTAAQLVNTLSQNELTRLITEHGEESYSFAKRIASAIVKKRPLASTQQLANIILEQHRSRWQRIHPATRTFQALRITVNQELEQIAKLLPYLPRILKSGGRIGIISFHSLEDRLVKNFFKSQQAAGLEGELDILTKKPLSGAIYDASNPRARSAKLRLAVKK
jgi:16S rRNA (cytosine1402-N4)-methyltransferase